MGFLQEEEEGLEHNDIEFARYDEPERWTWPPVRICENLTDIPKREMPPVVLQSLFLEHMAVHRNDVAIYTDGSRSENGTGAAAILKSGDARVLRRHLPGASSSYSAELRAIQCALELVDQSTEDSFTVYSDSRSALMALAAPYPRNPIVVALREKLCRLDEGGKQVSFCWVPAHVGVAGNEEVDAKAGEAVNKPITEVPVLLGEGMVAYRRAIRETWQEEWDRKLDNKLHSIKPKLGPWKSSFHPENIRR